MNKGLSENSKITISLAVLMFGVAAWAARLDSRVDTNAKEIAELKQALPEIQRKAESANTKLDVLIQMYKEDRGGK